MPPYSVCTRDEIRLGPREVDGAARLGGPRENEDDEAEDLRGVYHSRLPSRLGRERDCSMITAEALSASETSSFELGARRHRAQQRYSSRRPAADVKP